MALAESIVPEAASDLAVTPNLFELLLKKLKRFLIFPAGSPDTPDRCKRDRKNRTDQIWPAGSTPFPRGTGAKVHL